MKLVVVATLAVLVAALPATAVYAGEHDGHAGMHAAKAQVAMAEGVIKKVDEAGGKLTIAHGPLPNGMAPMTMTFALQDKAWAKRFKVGDKVRFALDDALTVVRIEAAK